MRWTSDEDEEFKMNKLFTWQIIVWTIFTCSFPCIRFFGFFLSVFIWIQFYVLMAFFTPLTESLQSRSSEYYRIAWAETILFPLLNICMLVNWCLMMGYREVSRKCYAGRDGLSERSLQPNRSFLEFLCWRKKRSTLYMELELMDNI